MSKDKAKELCIKLASDLDAGDRNSITPIVNELNLLPVDDFFSMLREHIGLERMVIHNLDMHKEFVKLLKKITLIYKEHND